MKRFTEAPEKLAFIFDGPKVTLDEKSVKKNLLKEGCQRRRGSCGSARHPG